MPLHLMDKTNASSLLSAEDMGSSAKVKIARVLRVLMALSTSNKSKASSQIAVVASWLMTRHHKVLLIIINLVNFGHLSYFSYFDESQAIPGPEDEDSCVETCEKDTSCKACFFKFEISTSKGYCFFIADVLTLMTSPKPLEYYSSLHMKVPNSHVNVPIPSPYPPPPFFFFPF